MFNMALHEVTKLS